MKRLQFVLPFLVLALLALDSYGQSAHWQELSNPELSYPAGIYGHQDPLPYFLNTQIGFVYCSNTSWVTWDTLADTLSHLNRTLDGGVTWKYLGFFDSIGFDIRQLYFVTINHGYAAGTKGIYETFDTGSTWKRISPDQLPYCSVYATGTTVYGFQYPVPGVHNYFGSLSMSANDGQSWRQVFPGTMVVVPIPDLMSPYVFGNKDSLVFAENYDYSGFSLWYSTENGNSWRTSHFNRITPHSFAPLGLFCSPHCKKITGTFDAPESTPDQFTIEESDDYGASWHVLMPSREIGQWIAGNNCALYVSDASEESDMLHGVTPFSLGPMRSTDMGNTWDTITYPNNEKWGPFFAEIDDHIFFEAPKSLEDAISDWRNLSVVGLSLIHI